MKTSKHGKYQLSNANTVELFVKAYPPEVQELALAASGLLLEALPGAEVSFDETAKVIGYGYGSGYKGIVCTLLLSRTGVKIGIARGAELPDPKQLMQGSGKVHRHVQLRTVADLRRPGLKPLLKAALAAWKKRSEGKS
jgi:hypothetical protein